LGSNDNTILAPFTLYIKDSKTNETALVDSGATENFLDFHTIKQLNLGTNPLEIPHPIINADGSLNGKVALT